MIMFATTILNYNSYGGTFCPKNQTDYYTSIEQVAYFIVEIELPQLCGFDAGNMLKIKALFEVLATVNGIHRNIVIEYLK